MENSRIKQPVVKKHLFPGGGLLFFGFLLLLGLAFVSLFLGRFTVPPQEVIGILLSKLLGRAEDSVNLAVVWDIRMPRILLAMLVGSGLSISGASFQGCFHNPLVSPDMLGVSAGAGFGAALGILLTNETNAVTGVFSFCVGLFSVFLSWFFSRIRKDSGTLSLVLAGVIVSSIFNALISLTKLVADTDSQLPAITFWLMGSLNGTTFRTFWIAFFPVAAGTALLLALRWRINVLTLGDDEASSLGVNPTRVRMLVVVSATVVTAATVMVGGIIGWVGLIVPNLCRMMVGSDHRRLLPASCIVGAVFLLAVDLLARSATAAEIPLGILTALIGAPFFALVYKRGENTL